MNHKYSMKRMKKKIQSKKCAKTCRSEWIDAHFPCVCVSTAHLFAAVRGICDVQEGSLFLINFKPPFNDTIASRCSPFMPNICKKLIYEKSLTDFLPLPRHIHFGY